MCLCPTLILLLKIWAFLEDILFSFSFFVKGTSNYYTYENSSNTVLFLGLLPIESKIILLSLHFTYHVSNVEEPVDCYEFENALCSQIVDLVYGSCWCNKQDHWLNSHVFFKYQD